MTDSSTHHHLVLESSVRDNSINQGLEKMYQLEFPEQNTERKSLSHEDQQFLALMQDSIHKKEGRYQLPLPFRNPDPLFPNNRAYALHRLNSIKKKMQKD